MCLAVPGKIVEIESDARPVEVVPSATSVAVRWKDGGERSWQAEFSLDPVKPLLTAVTVDGRAIVERANPVYRCATGKRRGGWPAAPASPAAAKPGPTC